MRIGIDVSPLESGHSVRGVGFYLTYLLDALERFVPEHTFIRFTHLSKLKVPVDLIHIPYFDPFVKDLPLGSSFTTMVTVHDLVPIIYQEQFPSGIRGSLRWRQNKKNLEKVQAIITDSNTSKKDIENLLQIDKKKIYAVHLAPSNQFVKKTVSQRERLKLKEKYNLPENFMLYVGDATANKNLPFLLRTVSQTELPLVCIGSSLAEKEIDSANQWNYDLVISQSIIDAAQNITSLGFVPTEDLVLLYNTAECLLLPSIYEGFGLPLVEAMSSGCPVICSDIPTFKEIAGESVIYFETKNKDDLLERIHGVYGNEGVKKSLREKGLEQVKQYSWEKTARQTVSVYKSVEKYHV